MLTIDARGGVDFDADILADRLRGHLVNTNAFIVFSRMQMENILGKQRFQLSGLTSAENAVRAGRLLNVQKIAMGSIGRLNKTYSLDISVIDVESGRIERSFNVNHKGSTDELLEKVEQIAREMAEALGLTPPSPFGYISISGNPNGADVSINGEKAYRVPLERQKLPVGEHIIEISKNGYLSHKETVVVESGKTTELNFTLRRLFRLRIDSKPDGAKVTINNVALGKTPVSKLAPEGMRLNIVLKLKGYRSWRYALALQEDTDLSPKLLPLPGTKRRSSSKAWLWVASGAATAGVAAYLLLSQQPKAEPATEGLPAFPWPPERK
jgi:hypothetical protein